MPEYDITHKGQNLFPIMGDARVTKVVKHEQGSEKYLWLVGVTLEFSSQHGDFKLTFNVIQEDLRVFIECSDEVAALLGLTKEDLSGG